MSLQPEEVLIQYENYKRMEQSAVPLSLSSLPLLYTHLKLDRIITGHYKKNFIRLGSRTTRNWE